MIVPLNKYLKNVALLGIAALLIGSLAVVAFPSLYVAARTPVLTPSGGPPPSDTTVSPRLAATQLATATPAGYTYFYVGAKANGADTLPNQGVKTTINVFPQSDSSTIPAYYIALTSAKNMWLQLGYYTKGGYVYTFAQLWNLSTGGFINQYGALSSLAVGDHEFTIVYSGTGTTWNAEIDGNVVFTADMGSTSSDGAGANPIYIVMEQQTAGYPVALQNVLFSQACSVFRNGVWTPTQLAYSFLSVRGPSSGSLETGVNGVAGMLQNSSLSADQLLIGGGVPSIASSIKLWDTTTTSTPTLTSLSLTPLSSTVAQGGSEGFMVTALDQNKATMQGVSGSILLNGVQVGTFGPTNSSGSAGFSETFNTAGSNTVQATSGSVSSNIATVSVTPSQPNPNLLANPGFETGSLTPWTLGSSTAPSATATVQSSVVHSGGFALQLTETSNTETAIVKQSVSGLLPNTTYNLSVFIKTQGIVSNPSTPGSGAELELYDPNTGVVKMVKPDIIGTVDWTHVSFQYITGASTAHPLVIELNLRHCTGTAWFDDVDFWQN